MNYEFYADVFFLTNCYLDFLAVYAVGELLEQKKRLLRYVICSALSSLLGCVFFLSMGNYDAYLLCVHFIVNPAMVMCCFFPAERKLYVKAFCLMYFVILLLGGSVEWLYVTVAHRTCYELCLLAAAIPIAVFLFILRRKRKNVQRFYRVLLRQGENTVDVLALYDTGNGLKDPYVKEPVHIVSKEALCAFGGAEAFPCRLIPFSSVGCENGMLKAFTIEELTIWEENTVHKISPAVLAEAEGAIFLGRPYQMILNSKSLERKEEKICT